MEASLVLVQDPIKCPVCFEAGRIGFLFHQTPDEKMFGVNGQQSALVCKTCGALFTVKENNGKSI